MNLPAFVILALLCAGLFKDISFLASLLFILPVFGSLALIPPSIMGDTTILPVSLAALFLIIKAFCYKAAWASTTRSMLDVRQMGLLCLFLIIAVAGAFILPHMFAGTVRVCPIRLPLEMPLSPTGANLTQSAYLLLSSLTAIVMSVLIKKQGFLDIFFKALLYGACAVIATGLLDIVANAAGLSSVITYFQTASYTFMNDNYVAGARRTIGLMPEASSYGMMAASYSALLLFLRPAYPPDLWRWKVPAAALGCLLMACLSTSSTAFVMVSTIALLYVFYRTHRIRPDGVIIKKTIFAKAMLLVVFIAVLFLVAVFENNWAAYIANFLDDSLVHKVHTSSFVERSHWNQIALQALSGTYGIGVGTGSVRTSNFFINILASNGYLGALIFALFLFVVYTRPAPFSEPQSAVVMTALRFALIPMFTGFALAGTTPDFGIMQGAIFGVIIGLGQRNPPPV